MLSGTPLGKPRRALREWLARRRGRPRSAYHRIQECVAHLHVQGGKVRIGLAADRVQHLWPCPAPITANVPITALKSPLAIGADWSSTAPTAALVGCLPTTREALNQAEMDRVGIVAGAPA